MFRVFSKLTKELLWGMRHLYLKGYCFRIEAGKLWSVGANCFCKAYKIRIFLKLLLFLNS